MSFDSDANENILKAFAERTDISVRRVDSVWSLPPWDTPSVNEAARRAIDQKVSIVSKGADGVIPGLPVVGPAGAGKTHLLSYLYRKTIEAGGYFILANMENMEKFWPTIAHYFLLSFECLGLGGEPQKLLLARRLAEVSEAEDPARLSEFFETADATSLAKLAKGIHSGLFKKRALVRDPAIALDLIRSVVFLSSQEYEFSTAGVTWIQSGDAQDPDPEAMSYGFRRRPYGLGEVVIGLTRLMALGGGFTAVGMDQLDNVLLPPALSFSSESDVEMDSEERLKLADRISLAKIAIGDLSQGLASLINNASSTLVVATVLADGWTKLTETASGPAKDRFEASPVHLPNLTRFEQFQELVARRMGLIFKESSISPPYPAWPFSDDYLRSISALTPRELLRKVESHLDSCVSSSKVVECLASGPDAESGGSGTGIKEDPIAKLEARFKFLVEERENSPGFQIGLAEGLSALVSAFYCGQPERSGSEWRVGEDRPDSKKSKYSYEYIRYFSSPGHSPDFSLSLWAIDSVHARSFQSQLKAAMVQSGVNKKKPERRLCVARLGDFPGGSATAQLIEDFDKTGTCFWLKPFKRDMAVMDAMRILGDEAPQDYVSWLRARKPFYEARFAAPHLAWLAGEGEVRDEGVSPKGGFPEADFPKREASEEKSPDDDFPDDGDYSPGDFPEADMPGGNLGEGGSSPSGTSPQGEARFEGEAPVPISGPLIFGKELDLSGDDLICEASIDSRELCKHVAVFGASGSGKTFLLKRLIDEAALLGVPSVVLDRSGDLCTLGRRWDSPPERWLSGDEEKAARLFKTAETVIWTPGISKGNPLSFRLIPDFSAMGGDEDAIEEAIGYVASILISLAEAKSTQRNTAVLVSSLRALAARGGDPKLDDLLKILNKPPEAVRRDFFKNASKIAEDLAANIKATIVNKPEIDSSDNVDVSALLRSPSGKARISVVYLGGLGTDLLKQQFAQQIITRLFRFISLNPERRGELSGLLVIDEAKDLAPARQKAISKDSIIQFSNQARKYGFGLILASQEISSVDLNVINNCNTVFIGRQNSGTPQKNANARLGNASGVDVGALGPHRFYLKTPANEEGVQVRLIEPAFSLSRHDRNPPSPEEIVEMAAGSAQAPLSGSQREH